ncbi:MAG: ATP-binding protein [Desulfobulbaceae bacterium]|nr:ATP-binding protein [Desulfobulbaceae bacterium]
MKVHELTTMQAGETSAAIKTRVSKAHTIQQARFAERTAVYFNSQMGPRDIKRHCSLDTHGQELLLQATTRLGLSARAYHRILKIARTIADLEESPSILSRHLAEAIQYRRLPNQQ